VLVARQSLRARISEVTLDALTVAAQNLFDPKSFLSQLTTQPGVYRMYDARDELLYVGKARNLKKRVGSYFLRASGDPRIESMVSQIARMEVTLTANEDEALLLGIARDNPDVLNVPEPAVFVVAADHAGHLMELHVRLPGDVQGRLKCISALNKAVLENLARLGQSLAPNP